MEGVSLKLKGRDEMAGPILEAGGGMEFGELIDVDLRETWVHEANDFTPWLAENMHLLS